jgi:hypothetical protein
MMRDKKVNACADTRASTCSRHHLLNPSFEVQFSQPIAKEMTMLTGQFLVLLVVFVVVVAGGMFIFSKLASKMVTHAIQDRLHALQEIVEGRIPDVWLRPFQRRVTALRSKAASEAQFARLGRRIQKYCLRNLDEMTRYITNIKIADTEATHRTILADLKAQQQAWPAKDWREWIAHVEELDTPHPIEEDQTDFSSAD